MLERESPDLEPDQSLRLDINPDGLHSVTCHGLLSLPHFGVWEDCQVLWQDCQVLGEEQYWALEKVRKRCEDQREWEKPPDGWTAGDG